MAKIKCTVQHPNLHLAVGGELQAMEQGRTITVEEKHVKRHLDNGNLVRVDSSKAVEIGGKDEDKPTTEK